MEWVALAQSPWREETREEGEGERADSREERAQSEAPNPKGRRRRDETKAVYILLTPRRGGRLAATARARQSGCGTVEDEPVSV